MKKLGLINYEGDCLVAIKNDNGILIKDQYGVELNTITVPELYAFIDGLINIVDSKGKSWNYPYESYDAKPSSSMIYHFVKDSNSEESNKIKIKMDKEQAKDKLIELLMGQVVDLSMMSKIELGEDVITEIKRLKTIINEQAG